MHKSLSPFYVVGDSLLLLCATGLRGFPTTRVLEKSRTGVGVDVNERTRV